MRLAVGATMVSRGLQMVTVLVSALDIHYTGNLVQLTGTTCKFSSNGLTN